MNRILSLCCHWNLNAHGAKQKERAQLKRDLIRLYTLISNRNVKTEVSFYFKFRMMGTLHAWILLLRDNRLSRASLFKVT